MTRGISTVFPSHAASVGEVDRKELDFTALLRIVWRRRWLIVLVVALVTGLAILKIWTTTPRYVSEALVEIETRSEQVVNLDQVVPTLTVDKAAIATEIGILESLPLASQVVDSLDLVNEPEFQPKPDGCQKILALTGNNPCEWLDLAIERIWPNHDVVEAAAIASDPRQHALAVFTSRLQVNQVGDSLLLAVRFESSDPDKAAEIANAVVDTYLGRQVGDKKAATDRASTWLKDRLEGLRERVQQAENAVEDYRSREGLTSNKTVGVTQQQLSEINTLLVTAQSDRAEAEARLRQVRRAGRSASGVSASSDVLSSELIQDLRQEESRLLRQVAELANEFGDKHPKMISARTQLQDLQSKIDLEIDRIVEKVANEVAVAQAREATLQQRIDDLKGQVSDLGQAEVRLRELEREADASRELYQKFLLRFQETSEQRSLQRADAKVVSRAQASGSPSYPKPLFTIIAAFMGSLCLSGVLILVLELLDPGFRSAEQIEKATGVPVIALIPDRPAVRRQRRAAVAALEDPRTREALRFLGTGLMLLGESKEAKGQVILVTSSLPQEGKSVLASALARDLASSGKRCLLIDCDLRRPQTHEIFEKNRGPGLSDLVQHEALPEDVIHTDRSSGLNYVTAGSPTPNPTQILGSPHFQDFISATKAAFDYVILDTPPVVVVSDPQAIAKISDVMLYVVAWARTRRETVRVGLKKMMDAGANHPQVVLSRVNARKYASYGFADAGVYTKTYDSYYY